MDDFGPIAPPLTRRVEVPDDQAFVVTPAIAKSEAERVARAAIFERLLRPGDIEGADVAPPVAVYTPIWCVDASVDGFHVGLVSTPGRGIRGVMPTGGGGHKDSMIYVLARMRLAFDPTAKIAIRPHQMMSRAVTRMTNGEIVEPDVTRAAAEDEAKARLLRQVRPGNALYQKYEATVRSAALCHYPVWLVRYRYRGEAAEDAGAEVCHVAVSARTGKVVSAHHPSSWKSVAGRIKSLFK